jgi:hypothetical protein
MRTRFLGLVALIILCLWTIAPALPSSSVIFVDCTLPVETPGNFKTLTAALQYARENSAWSWWPPASTKRASPERTP